MKKIAVLLLSLLLIFSFSMQSEAKLKNNPTKNYSVMVSYEVKNGYAKYYSKPDGKIMGKLSPGYVVSENGQPTGYGNSSMKVLKAVNSKWLKVKLEKNSYKYSKKYAGASKYKRVFYVKMSDISVTTEGGPVNNFVTKGNPAPLKAKKNSKSKTIVKIPVGTYFDYEYIIYSPDVTYSYPYNQKWVHVKYMKNGKLYKGFVNVKHIQVY